MAPARDARARRSRGSGRRRRRDRTAGGPWPGAASPIPVRGRRARAAARRGPAPPRALPTRPSPGGRRRGTGSRPANSSGSAPTRVAITGTPSRPASTTTMGNPSWREGRTRASTLRRRVPTSRPGGRKRTRAPTPQRRGLARQLRDGEQRGVERLHQQVAAGRLEAGDQPGDVLERHQAPHPAEGRPPAARERIAALPSQVGRRSRGWGGRWRRGSAAPRPARRRPPRRSPAASAARNRGRRRRGRCAPRGSSPAAGPTGDRRQRRRHGVRHPVPEHHVGGARGAGGAPSAGGRRSPAPKRSASSSRIVGAPPVARWSTAQTSSSSSRTRSPSATAIMAVSPPPRTTWGKTRQRRSSGIAA